MEKFINISSTGVPLPAENVDTDQIIPARFLKATTKTGFGENLFRDWRYDSNGDPNPDFILNSADKDSKILVAGKNFGCGSSREHAAWALHDYGFRVVVSSFFADIFKNNALNTNVLPVQVTDDFLTDIFRAIEKNKETVIHVNLKEQVIEIPELGRKEFFSIPLHKKTCLMEGYDDIDFLLSMKKEIEFYEKTSQYLRLLNESNERSLKLRSDVSSSVVDND
ncbi:3-isopropylmalate dehydratase small subunit [Sphingobacteriaceae bacterium]|nr:3-isopropylmalate dehydratase small subunit [Sphingobacteriaceae bacterium]